MHRALPVAAALLTSLACADGGRKLTEPADGPAIGAASPITPRIEAGVMKFDGPTAQVVGPSTRNPRSQAGMLVECFDGDRVFDAAGDPYDGECKRFQPTKDGAELITNGGDPEGEYAGVFAMPQTIRGKLLGAVQELRYSYAGGSFIGGSPRWSVAIDENGNGKHEDTEAYAFADIGACNDGDTSVGTSDAEDDPTCTWFYEAESFPNWDAFAGAHPTYRVARQRADGSPLVGAVFIVQDQPGHYLIWNVQAN